MLKLKRLAKQKNTSINLYLTELLENSSEQEIRYGYKELLKTLKSSSLYNGLKAIILFGSLAKGTQREGSDCDLLLVMSKEVKISRSLYHRWEKEIESKISTNIFYGLEISPHFVALPEDIKNVHSLWLEVAISGIILWEKDKDTEFLLQKIRLHIANGDFQRKLSYGQPYWLRNI